MYRFNNYDYQEVWLFQLFLILKFYSVSICLHNIKNL